MHQSMRISLDAVLWFAVAALLYAGARIDMTTADVVARAIG